MPIRILLINNQELLRIGLQKIFQSKPDIELVGIAKDFAEGLLLIQQYAPDLVLFDYMLHEANCALENGKCMLRPGNCIERIPELLMASPTSKVLILTACQNQERHLLALRQGAIGIFLLNQPIELLINAIHKVCAGEAWISHSMTQELLKGYKKTEPEASANNCMNVTSLTPRELKIAALLAQGNQPKRIAETLFISEKTIRNVMVQIYSKLNIHSQIELMVMTSQLEAHDTIRSAFDFNGDMNPDKEQ